MKGLSTRNVIMKYVTATISAIFIFIIVWFLSGMILILIMPDALRNALGYYGGILYGLVVFILSATAGAYTFKTSLHAKSWKLYRNQKSKKTAM